MNLQLEYPEHFPGHMNCSEMAKYLSTDEGTVRVATIFMMDAKAKADFLKPFSDDDKKGVAFLITIYKQGLENFKQRVDKARQNKLKKIMRKGSFEPEEDKYEPGEGNAIVDQWEKFVRILGLDAD